MERRASTTESDRAEVDPTATAVRYADPDSPATAWEVAEDALVRGYLPLRLQPKHPNPPRTVRLNMTELGTTTVGRLHFGADVTIASDELSNFHINMPLSGRSRTRSGAGWDIDNKPGTGALFSPGATTTHEWSTDADMLCIMIDSGDVTAELEALLGRTAHRPLTFDPMLDLTDPAKGPWLESVRMITRNAGRDDGPLSFPLVRRRMEQLLAGTLLVTQTHNYTDELTILAAGSEPSAVNRALQLINDRPEHPWTATELAIAVGIGARALQAAMVKATGQGPSAHLRAVRMTRAHEDLREANVDRVTVATIAHRWGFAHLGRFAIAYRERFGVSPSETLRLAFDG